MLAVHLEESLEQFWYSHFPPCSWGRVVLVPSEVRYGHMACFVQRNRTQVTRGYFWRKFQEPVWEAPHSHCAAVWSVSTAPSLFLVPGGLWWAELLLVCLYRENVRQRFFWSLKSRRFWNCLKLLRVLAHCDWFSKFKSRTRKVEIHQGFPAEKIILKIAL